MFCSNCGSQLEEGSVFCPNCGTKNLALENQQKPAEEPAQAPAQAPQFTVAPAYAPAAPKKKGKGLKIALCIIIPLVIIGIVVALLFSSLSNFFMKSFASPEDYYKHVEKENVDTLSSEIASLYGDALFGDKKGVDGVVKLELGESTLAIIENATGEDMSWLKDVTISFDAAQLNSMSQATLGLAHGGSDIAGVDLIYDSENEKVLFGLPGISESYASVNIAEYMAEMPDTSVIVDALPGEDALESLLAKYIDIVTDNVTKVTKTSETLQIGEVAQNCTVLTAEIDEETLYNIVVDVLNAAKNDKELRKIIIDVINAVNASYPEEYQVNADEAYASMLEEIDYLLSDIENPEFGDTVIYIKNYVASNGDIVARNVYDDYQSYVFFGEATKGKQYAAELRIAESMVTVSGSGTKKGDARTGSYTVMVEGMNMGRIDVEKFVCDSDDIEGKIVIKPELGYFLEDAPSILGSLDLSLVMDIDDDSVKFDVLNGEASMLALSVEAEETKPKKINMPANVIEITSEEDLEQWLNSLDPEKLMNNLQASNIPEEFIYILEDLFTFSESVSVEQAPAYGDDYYYEDNYDDDYYYGDYSENVDGY